MTGDRSPGVPAAVDRGHLYSPTPDAGTTGPSATTGPAAVRAVAASDEGTLNQAGDWCAPCSR